ncbi:transcription antitermination factor NusB [Bacteroidia bacterium]|nr:transcription antitermination factor NusB [Bacteroidia bacterium]
MINRRLIRIKIFQSLFTELDNDETLNTQIQKSVKKSILDMEQNLLAVLSFGPELAHFISTDHNPNDYKYKTSDEDIKAFKIFTENSFFKNLANNVTVSNYLSKPKLSWSQEKETLFIIYKEIKKTEEFQELLKSDLTSSDFFIFSRYIFKYLIFNSVEFEQLMEEKNIYWYDEKIPILKSIERLSDDYEKQEKIILPNLFKNEKEDLKMVDDLVSSFLDNKSEIEQLLLEYTPDWDNDRMNKIDYTLILMALTEFRFMPLIPVKVSLNEYIEIAKMYSTTKSSKFINGTLDKILHDWKKQNLINKKGRGLVG